MPRFSPRKQKQKEKLNERNYSRANNNNDDDDNNNDVTGNFSAGDWVDVLASR